MTSEAAPVYTRRHWAKFNGEDRTIHLLEHHLADVGACFEALLAQPIIRQRLARAGGLESLDDATAARLCVFAALHDIGKVNVGFQTRVWQDADFPQGRRPAAFRHVGHYNELVPVLAEEWFFNALGWWHGATKSWDDRDGETVCALFIATLSHHGRPLQLDGGLSENPALWQRYRQLDPLECVERIGRLVQGWFPAAFSEGAPPLPSAPAFQHTFLGLCNWADWIGSNEAWFPYFDTPQGDYFQLAQKRAKGAISAIGLDLSGQRSAFTGVPVPGFGELFPHIDGPPKAIQQAAAADTPLDERLVIIESETGSGKTEAALWRFAKMYEAKLVDGLYFALPTRAAAVQIHGRVKGFIARLLPESHRPPVVLAVPGYEPGDDADAIGLPGYNPWWDDHHDAERPWATENPKRFLSAQVAVGTVDQAMMGALKVKHAHLRAACLSRNLLVVDEVHASDAYMSRILRALLEAHLGAGGYALLMSATLGSSARRSWLAAGQSPRAVDSLSLEEAIGSPYPAVSTTAPDGESLRRVEENGQPKTVGVSLEPVMHDFDAVARRALEAAREGAKVLVVRNTVGHAIRTQQALEEAAGPGDKGLLFDVGGVVTLHHGRFAAVDRQLLDRRVEELLGKERDAGGRVVVGTQTLEQSLDIDADLLITDLCPVDVLLQRIGRLHRHRRDSRPNGHEARACIVLTPGDDLSPLLARTENANGLGPHGGVYEDLRTLEATRRLAAGRGEWRIPEMNRELVERATHPEALKAIVAELGDEWQVHANNVEGGQIADGLTAANAILRRDKSFFTDNRDVLFGSLEERIRTRLGDDRVDVVFDQPPASPFVGSPRIERLAVSTRWLGGADVREPVSPDTTDGGFAFTIGDRRFIYDRLGLRRG